MKYGIEEQLAPAMADQAQRFLTAMLQRLHQLQLGAARDPENPVDAAIAVMEEWVALGQARRGAARAGAAEVCRFPSCTCPMDPGPEPDWCARGLPHAAVAGTQGMDGGRKG